MNILNKISLIGLLSIASFSSMAQETSLPYEGVKGWEETKDKRMAWFREARFGLFIHWGLYSAAAGSWDGKQYPQHYAEWIQAWAKIPSKTYAQVLKPKFTASKFKADEWASLAKEAGMRYVIITSRHHEGFSIFNSQQPYSLKNEITGGTNISPEGRDLYGEVITAFRKKGLKAGAYYSLLDWQHPDSYEGLSYLNSNPTGYKPDHENYKKYLYGQVKELANNYGGLDVLWLDFSSKKHQGESWGTKNILTDLIKWQPQVIVNNRFWDGLENKNGDIGTPEKYIPPTGLPGMDWEVSHTMNESYGYSAHDQNWKSFDKMMRLFIETVSKGGNFLLNVGPDAEGSIPEQAKTLLQDIGQWMNSNGDAIYGTTASPFQALDWGYSTQKAGKLYFHVFDIPADGNIQIPLSSPIQQAYLMGSPQKKLKIKSSATGKSIALPTDFKGIMPLVIVAEIKGSPTVIQSQVQTQKDGRIVLTANNAKLVGTDGIKLIGATTHDPNRPNAIGGWSKTSDQVAWDVKIQRPGQYKVVVNYLPHEQKAGSISIALGTSTLSHTLPSLKGNKFVDSDAGTIEISQQAIGDAALQIQLKALEIKGNSLPEISSISLIPVTK
ncbi:alpha-L-fucosidase [Sphingobacterium anhuiense]|uniref:alpha-L-fucosidase n=1 Tax=Sphingobacterium anhuiense TaxID=493780 RepID=UPI003C2E349D